jgi:hypothetical protein
MNATHDLERRITDYYATEAPSRAPDWLLAQALDSIDTTPQRRTMLGLPWRIPPMPTSGKLALTAVAIAAVGFVGLTLLRGPVIGPASTPSPTASPSPLTSTPSPRLAAEQIIAEGNLSAFAATASGTVLTVWDSCESQFQVTDCGLAWRLGTGPQPRATGMVGIGDLHVDAFAASAGGFVLTSAGQRGPDLGFLIAEDGISSAISSDCRGASWPTSTEPGRRVWVGGLNVVDTVTGAVCHSGRLGGRPLARGAFTADGALWALVDNEADPVTGTIGRYDGAEWSYRDLAAKGGSWTSVIAAAGSNVVVLQAAPEPSHQQLVGLSVTTDAGAIWSEVADPDVLARDLPFVAYRSPDSQDWFSDYTSMAFAGSTVLYVADGRGDLWRSTDFTTFSRVEVAGWVRGLQPTVDAVIARIGDGTACDRPAACLLNDLVRISADGSVEPITAR